MSHFKSCVTDFSAIRKRMEDLGFTTGTPEEGTENGVDVAPREGSQVPAPTAAYYYGPHY
jgi:hypothetical protein